MLSNNLYAIRAPEGGPETPGTRLARLTGAVTSLASTLVEAANDFESSACDTCADGIPAEDELDDLALGLAEAQETIWNLDGVLSELGELL
jgi:hypothetical protein